MYGLNGVAIVFFSINYFAYFSDVVYFRNIICNRMSMNQFLLIQEV
jgi:hypothetical protein